MRAVSDFLKNKWVAVPALVVLTLGLGSLAVFYTQGSFGTSNLCANQVSEVDLVGSQKGIDEAVFIDASAGCDNKIVGGVSTIPQDDLTVQDDGKTYEATQDFQLGLTRFDAWFSKEVNEDARSDVYRIRSRSIDCGWDGCGEQEYQQCVAWYNEDENFEPFGPYFPISGWSGASLDERQEWMHEGNSVGSFTPTLYCFRQEPAGEVALFEGDQHTGFEGEFTVRAGGQESSATIMEDRSAASITVFGDKKVHITNVGSYVGDVRSIDWSSFRPMCDGECNLPAEDVNWKLAGEQPYQDYADSINGELRQCLTQGVDAAIEENSPGRCVSQHNNHVDNTLSDQSSAFQDYIGGTDSDANWVRTVRSRGDEVQVVAEEGEKIGSPDFRIWGEFDWIGFDLVKTEPSIDRSALSEVNLKGLEQTTVKIPVRNTADVSGEIETNLQCGGSLSGGSQSKTVGAGEEANFFVTLNSEASETKDYSCTIESYDTDEPSGSGIDQASLSVHVERNAQDSDDDGVPDKWDSCPNTPGPESNNGCPAEEICGDGVDNDGDGQIDEGCEEDPPTGEEICGDGIDNDGDGQVDENCGDPGCVVFTVGDLEIEDPFCADGPLEMLSKMFHLVAGTAVAFFTGSLGYRAGRWVDGEYQIKGGFDPLKSRSVSRAKRGRFVIGLIAGAVSFLFGFYVILLVPIWAQLMVILGYALFKIYTPY